MDLLLPQFAHPANAAYGFRGTTIYKNQNGNFTDTYDSQIGGSSLGITYEETHAGAAWGDFDNDGLADFVITTYYGCRYIDLYKQTPDLKFKNVTYEAGLNRIVTGDDACWADYDNDGKLDLAMSIDRKFKLFKNYWSETNNNWVKLDLRSNKSNKFAIGARVKVYAGGKTYMQEVGAGRGQKMQKPYVLHFGLSQAQSIDKIEIRWPKSKEYVTYTNIPINQITKIVEEGVGVEQSDLNFSNYIHLTKSIIGNEDLEIEFGIVKSHNLLFEIVDLQGNVVISENLGNYNIGDYKHTIKIDKLQSGTYFVRLIVGGSTLFDKFVVVK
jgi:ASPIC and UnbV.